MGESVRVKICGLTRPEDARAADAAGAAYLGVVLTAGFGRSVAPSMARALVEGTSALKVAVVVDETADGAAAAAGALGADVIQLHGIESPAVLDELRARGGWDLWKAVRAQSIEDVERAVEAYSRVADGILVEGWKEGPPGVGGARLALDPARVRALVPHSVALILAGGLGPDSVADAVRSFRPDVVDVSSGVERALGVKDHGRVRAFVRAARAAGPDPATKDDSA